MNMQFNWELFKRDVKEFFEWKNLWLYLVIIVFFGVLALFIHELGHALAALIVGAEIEAAHVEFYLYPLGYRGFVTASGAGIFKHGLYTAAGVISTLIVSIIATICLVKCKLKNYAKAAVFVMSLYFLDALVDLFKRPVAGLNPTSREAVSGALEMGIPAGLTTGVVIIISITLLIIISSIMLKPYVSVKK